MGEHTQEQVQRNIVVSEAILSGIKKLFDEADETACRDCVMSMLAQSLILVLAQRNEMNRNEIRSLFRHMEQVVKGHLAEARTGTAVSGARSFSKLH